MKHTPEPTRSEESTTNGSGDAHRAHTLRDERQPSVRNQPQPLSETTGGAA